MLQLFLFQRKISNNHKVKNQRCVYLFKRFDTKNMAVYPIRGRNGSFFTRICATRILYEIYG